MTPTWYDDEADDLAADEARAIDGDEAPGAWRRFEQFVPDVVRRALLAGVGAVFMTEEGLRGALADLKLPKEAVAYLVGQAERSKRELTQALARELRAFLDDVDITGVLRRVLAGMTVEFRTQVRFIPHAEHLEPQISFEQLRREPPAAGDEVASKAQESRGRRRSRSAASTKTRRRKPKNKERAK